MADPFDYGADVSTHTNGDWDGSFAIMTGPRVLLEALLNRLECEPNTLVEDPEYGVGVYRYLNGPMTTAEANELQAKTTLQWERDQRVRHANVRVEFVFAQDLMKLFARITPKAGPPLAFVLAISNLGIDILQGPAT